MERVSGPHNLPRSLRADSELTRQITQRFSGGVAYPNEYITLLSGEAWLQGRVEAANETTDGCDQATHAKRFMW